MESNGWLYAFVSQHVINMAKLQGESAEGLLEASKQWKSQLPKLCMDYSPDDIYDYDKTGFFFLAIPSRRFGQQGDPASRTMVVKECFTVLTCSVGSRKEKLWLIGKAKCHKASWNMGLTYSNISFIGTTLRPGWLLQFPWNISTGWMIWCSCRYGKSCCSSTITPITHW